MNYPEGFQDRFSYYEGLERRVLKPSPETAEEWEANFNKAWERLIRFHDDERNRDIRQYADIARAPSDYKHSFDSEELKMTLLEKRDYAIRYFALWRIIGDMLNEDVEKGEYDYLSKEKIKELRAMLKVAIRYTNSVLAVIPDICLADTDMIDKIFSKARAQKQ